MKFVKLSNSQNAVPFLAKGSKPKVSVRSAIHFVAL